MERDEYLKEYFYLDLSPISNRYLVKPNLDLVPCYILEEGNYCLLASRLLGLTYASYCRFCRDILHATLSGKNNYYVVVSFSNKIDAELLSQILNARMALLLAKRDFPLTEEWETYYQTECAKIRRENNLDD